MPNRVRCPHCEMTFDAPIISTKEYPDSFVKCPNPICENIVDMKDNYVGDNEI